MKKAKVNEEGKRQKEEGKIHPELVEGEFFRLGAGLDRLDLNRWMFLR